MRETERTREGAGGRASEDRLGKKEESKGGKEEAREE